MLAREESEGCESCLPGRKWSVRLVEWSERSCLPGRKTAWGCGSSCLPGGGPVLACPGGGGPASLLAREEIVGGRSCLPGRKVVRASLLAREESGRAVLACPGGEWPVRLACPGGDWLVGVLACPGGEWSVRPCLPGRSWGQFLREERRMSAVRRKARASAPRGDRDLACWRIVPSVLAFREKWGCESCLPGRKVVRASLLAREESGPCVLACPGGESVVQATYFFPRQIGAIRWLGRLNKHYI